MRVAVICNPIQDRDGFGDFLYRGFKQVVDATHFNTGEETEGFDYYYYIDDGPSYYEEPKFHPATYFAIDFVLPQVYYVQSTSQYINRLKAFDHSYVFTSKVLNCCHREGVNAKLLGFAADPEHHYPKCKEKYYDWSAIWMNYGDRLEATVRAMERFPIGFVAWRGTGEAWGHDDDLAKNVSSSRCTLNVLRANMVNMRVFESMAIGTPLITQRHPDLKKFGFKEGRHYMGFDSIGEMLDSIQWVKDYPKEAEAMAKRARRLVLKRHTYRHRAEKILSETISGTIEAKMI